MFVNELRTISEENLNLKRIEQKVSALHQKCKQAAREGSRKVSAEVLSPGENAASRYPKTIVSLSKYSSSAEDLAVIQQLKTDGLEIFYGVDGGMFLRW